MSSAPVPFNLPVNVLIPEAEREAAAKRVRVKRAMRAYLGGCDTCARRSWALRHCEEYGYDEDTVVELYGRAHEDEAYVELRRSKDLGLRTY